MNYDVVVIGAGPAGSSAAREAARLGASVLVLEKHAQVGTPVCCGEAVSFSVLLAHVAPRPSWVSARLDGGVLVAPDGAKAYLRHPDAGFILERRVFDRDLAGLATSAGAECWTEAQAVGLEFDGRTARGVRVMRDGREELVGCGAVIGADGVEGRVARWAKMRKPEPIDGYEVCAQYLMTGVGLERPGYSEFHVGNSVAPGGYAWVFPKGDTLANVGVGVDAKRAGGRSAFQFLDEFVSRRCPGARAVERSGGGIPKYSRGNPLVRGNVLLAGDAGALLDPFTGAGIANAIISGELAGRAAAEWLREGKRSGRLERYHRDVVGTIGKKLKHSLLLRAVCQRMSDDDFSRVVRFIPDLFPGGSTTAIDVPKVFAAIFRRHPSLLLMVRRLAF